MKFRTEYRAENHEGLLSPTLPVALVGSCFTENIALRMRSASWRAENPLGTLFNPVSIADDMELAVANSKAEDVLPTIFKTPDGMFRSWAFDSRFMASTPIDCAAACADACRKMKETIECGKVLCVTFGTAWCYVLRDAGRVVANCHKQPQGLFERYRLSVREISSIWSNLLERMKMVWPRLKVIFTVSPVRHLKDGFAGNSRSKAILLLAVEEICRENEDCFYFPAFEILNDDLRDYRFYASDLVHPSADGVDYVWEKFTDTFLSHEGRVLLSEGERLYRAASHRSLAAAGSGLSGELEMARFRHSENVKEMGRVLRASHERLEKGAPGLILP